MKIILASASPRRKELLEMMGLEFEIIPSQNEEKIQEGLKIEEQIEKIAKEKAEEVYKKTKGEDRIVIGADTIVVKENKIYGKPKSREDAKNMIMEFSGKCHKVITGLCVIIEKQGDVNKYVTHDITEIWVKNMQDAEIEEWLDRNIYKDKAGAYAIQEEFGKYIEKINGSYFNIVGLPIHILDKILKNN